MAVIRIAQFDTWQAGYGLATVTVYQAGTTTLADIFTDEALSASAANPQTLEERTDGDISYGKFSAPLYVGVAYELLINSIDGTGVIRPGLTTLVDEDASDALVTVTGGTEEIALADHLARRIDVRDFGDFIAVGGVGASAATNQTTLTTAIGVASAAGGGFVEAPPGTYAHTGGITVPQGVVLRGAGRGATVLQSTLAGNVWIIGGSRAGFSRLTLDGVTLVGSSVGIFAANKDEIVLDDVEIKRFETGIYRKGGSRATWRDFYLSNCTNGARLHGDTSSSGAALSFNDWQGGKVELCGTVGVEFKYVDAACEYNAIKDVLFDTNTGTAVKITGARSVELRHCQWSGNTANLSVADASPATTSNTVKGVEITDGTISGGTMGLSDTLENVAFRRMVFSSVAVTLTSPANNAHVEDSREQSVTIAGSATYWRRHRTSDRNSAQITTTDAAVTAAWATTLVPRQHAILEAKVFARRIDDSNYSFWHKAVSVIRNTSSLLYETQTGNFTGGATLTGQTSGATAIINDVLDAGATGELRIYDIVGTFVDNEIITDNLGGSATANGGVTDLTCLITTIAILTFDGQTVNFVSSEVVTGGTSSAFGTVVDQTDAGATGTLSLAITHGSFLDNEAITGSSGGAAVANGTQTYEPADLIRANEPAFAPTEQYDARFIANGSQVELRVTGVAGHTVEWTVDVDVTRS